MKHAGDCKHYNGIMHPGAKEDSECCKAGVNYVQLCGTNKGIWQLQPCVRSDFRGDPIDRRGAAMVECSRYAPLTSADEKAFVAETDAMLATISAGLSICCKAPLDRSRLLQSGRFKGNGWVFCSSCKKPVLHVNAGHAHEGE